MSYTKDDWKSKWMKLKGQPWKIETCPCGMTTCYNCIVQALAEDHHVVSSVDITWYNLQVITCCKAVLDSYSNIQSMSTSYLCDDIIKLMEQIGKLFEVEDDDELTGTSNLLSEILSEMKRLKFCLCVVWFVKSSKSFTTLCRELLQEQNHALGFPKTTILKLLLAIGPTSDDKATNLLDKTDLEDLCLQRGTDASGSITYLIACVFFKQKQYNVALKVCLDHLNGHESEGHAMPLLYNIVACCYTRLCKPLTAIIYWRKAIQCQDEDLYMVPVMFNLQQTYNECNMTEASRKMLGVMAATAYSNTVENDDTTHPMFLLSLDKSGETTAIVTSKQHISDMHNIKYYVAKYYLDNNIREEAIGWYKDFAESLTAKFNPSKSTNADNYTLPITVPSAMQVQAELCHAYAAEHRHDDVLQIDCSDLNYCAKTFMTAQSKVPHDELMRGRIAEEDVISYNAAAVQLYHCICIMLCKISSLILTDCNKARNEIELCLHAVENVLPALKMTHEQGDVEVKEEEETYHRITDNLGLVKSKLYFNLALAYTKQSGPQEDRVLKALQSSLQYDCRSIEMRWNVVMLLWKIGQKQESIKTWCKTRSINCKLDAEQLKHIKDEKSSLLSETSSMDRQDLLRKDVSILNELLNMIS